MAEQREVAQQFEAIFLRKLMGSLEKAGGFAGSASDGVAIFGSMMVGALVENVAASGGIGLADILFQAMMPRAAPDAPAGQPAGAQPATRAAGAQPEAATDQCGFGTVRGRGNAAGPQRAGVPVAGNGTPVNRG